MVRMAGETATHIISQKTQFSSTQVVPVIYTENDN